MVVCAGAVLTAVGMASTVNKIEEVVISKTPDAILASAGVDDWNDVALAVAYYDQKADPCVNLYDASKSKEVNARQFEWTECGYYNKMLERGLVDFYLNEELNLVGLSGKLTPNRGMSDLNRWFENVEGKSQSYSGQLKLKYERESASFSFESEKFYPLDEVKFSQGDYVNKDGHNHLFTMNFAVPFTVLASGEETFEIAADDDTFVFVGDALVIDLGGIHNEMTGRFNINEAGEVYAAVNDEELAYTGVNVNKNEGSIVRIFHADRDSANSVFRMSFSKMDLNVTNSELAGVDEGIQIAYDPADPSYVGPLGQSVSVGPDNTKGYVIIATTEGVIIVVLAVFTVVLARALVKNRV